MKKLFLAAVFGLISILSSIVLTDLINGESPKGLLKLNGLFAIFLTGSARPWIFAIVFFLILSGVQYFMFVRQPKQFKNRLHFIPDAHNCLWCEAGDTPTPQMYVSVGGMFTYEGEQPINLLKAYFKGTHPTNDMIVQVFSADASKTLINVDELSLDPYEGERAFIQLYLAPLVGTRGRSYCGKLIFLDQFNHKYPIDKVQFHYSGKP
jgi:hypothetical protein